MCCRLLVTLYLLLAMISCSPARSTFQPETFVPVEELLAVSLAREGLSNYERSRFLDSEFRLRQALHLAPKAENIILSLAIVLEAQERYSESAELFSALLKVNPESSVYLLGAGRSMYRQGLYVEAGEFFTKAYSQSVQERDVQQSARAARNLSLLNFVKGLEIEALCYSTEALNHRESPDEVLRHVRLMTALHRYQSASLFLRDYALRVNVENDSRFLTLLAALSLASDDYNRVVEYSERALQMPDVSGARFQLELMQAYAVQYADVVDEDLEPGEPEDSLQELDTDPDLVVLVPTPAEIVAAVRVDLLNTLYWPIKLLEVFGAAIEFLEEGQAEVSAEKIRVSRVE